MSPGLSRGTISGSLNVVVWSFRTGVRSRSLHRSHWCCIMAFARTNTLPLPGSPSSGLLGPPDWSFFKSELRLWLSLLSSTLTAEGPFGMETPPGVGIAGSGSPRAHPLNMVCSSSSSSFPKGPMPLSRQNSISWLITSHVAAEDWYRASPVPDPNSRRKRGTCIHSTRLSG